MNIRIRRAAACRIMPLSALLVIIPDGITGAAGRLPKRRDARWQ
jgi:hypothetical protein